VVFVCQFHFKMILLDMIPEVGMELESDSAVNFTIGMLGSWASPFKEAKDTKILIVSRGGHGSGWSGLGKFYQPTRMNRV
jgi:hypothetical protein